MFGDSYGIFHHSGIQAAMSSKEFEHPPLADNLHYKSRYMCVCVCVCVCVCLARDISI